MSAGPASGTRGALQTRGVVVRPSTRARISYAQWAFGGAVIIWSASAWAAGLQRTDAGTWILLVSVFVALLSPPMFLMRVVFREDGLLVRNYFRTTEVRWNEVEDVSVIRPPIPSPQRRFGWVLEIACRDGRKVTTGALLNATPRTVERVAAALTRASEQNGFRGPDDLSRLGLAR